MSDIRAMKRAEDNRVPDQHPPRSGAAQVTKPETLIRQFIAEDPSTAITSVLARVMPPKTRAACMNPACKKTRVWGPNDRGRAPKFCTDGCRLTFSRKRANLTQELAAYIELRSLGVADRAQIVQIDRRISLLRMHLLRYPSD